MEDVVIGVSEGNLRRDDLLIFVTVGNTVHGFDRLMAAIDTMATGEFLGETVFVQYGHSGLIPRGCTCVQSVSREVFRERIAEASMVITHGGAGSIGCCFQAGKKPIVVPRRKSFGEVVDDHQVDLVRVLAEQGRVYPVFDVAGLPSVVHTAKQMGAVQGTTPGKSSVGNIVKDFLDRL